MTNATQLNHTAVTRAGVAKLWASLAAIFRTTSEASVRIAYDKPWLRDARG